MNEDDIRGLFREMREEPVPLESLVRVRVRVEDRIQRRAPWKIAAWVTACAALAVAAFLIQVRPAPRKTVSPPVAEHRRSEPAPPIETVPPAEEPVTVRPAIERKVHKPRPQPQTQSVSIRIETPDPDVVILLVGQ